MAIRVKGTSFVYFPVPKVGCTSLKLAIMQHNQPQKYARLKSEEGVHGSSGYRSPPARWEWRTYARPSRMQAFCVIRDPIDRFVSGYRNRIVFHRDLGEEVPDMNEFAARLARYCRGSSHIRHHFMPMVEFTGRDPSFFDRVFLLEEMDLIPDYVGVPLSMHRAQEAGPKISRGDLSSDARDQLNRFYAEDYSIWGTLLSARQ